MIGKLNHVAIAVPNLDSAIETYSAMLGASVSEKMEQKEHGVTVAFVQLPNTKIELISPLSNESPIMSFLQKNPNGGDIRKKIYIGSKKMLFLMKMMQQKKSNLQHQ